MSKGQSKADKADKVVIEVTEGLQQLNDKLKKTLIQAEVIRVIGEIEMILSHPVEHYLPTIKEPTAVVEAMVSLNFDNKSNEAKHVEVYQLLEDVKLLHSFDDNELIQYMYKKVEAYIKWLERIKQDNYKTVEKFFNIGETI